MKKLSLKGFKNFAIGFIVGATILSSGSAFASTVSLTKIQAYLNNDLTIVHNGKNVSLSNTPITYNGKTYLPLTDVGSLTNTSVKYNQKERSVEMTSNDVIIDDPNNENASNEITIIEDYISLEDGNYYAIKMNDTVYVHLGGGSKKYDLFLETMFDKTRGVYFKGHNKDYAVYNEPQKDCDAFFYRGNVFIKEKILQSIVKTPE